MRATKRGQEEKRVAYGGLAVCKGRRGGGTSSRKLGSQEVVKNLFTHKKRGLPKKKKLVLSMREKGVRYCEGGRTRSEWVVYQRIGHPHSKTDVGWKGKEWQEGGRQESVNDRTYTRNTADKLCPSR